MTLLAFTGQDWLKARPSCRCQTESSCQLRLPEPAAVAAQLLSNEVKEHQAESVHPRISEIQTYYCEAGTGPGCRVPRQKEHLQKTVAASAGASGAVVTRPRVLPSSRELLHS